jgi:hypothetical protein
MITTGLAQNASELATLITCEALAMAEEFDQIRNIYGEECLSFVKLSLRRHRDNDWHTIVDQAISGWISENPRMNFDLLG